MTSRDRTLAVLNYRPYDRLPLLYFRFWNETVRKWVAEGHVSEDDVRLQDNVAKILGFDYCWDDHEHLFWVKAGLQPGFETQELKCLPDGTRHVLSSEGVVVAQRPDVRSIPAEIDHLLKDRASWEEHYKWRLQWSPERVTQSSIWAGDRPYRFDEGGLDWMKREERAAPLGLHCGSLYGIVRNILGLEGSCYLLADDEPLFDEIIETVADLCYRNVEYALQSGARFDFGHFWEDICFKNGPLINPSVFRNKVGPHYARITRLLKSQGVDIVSLDCDGKIDALVPVWCENGVNTMFPIEVGTWRADIKPWRAQFGKALRGVGGMDKTVLARDRAAVDAEVERLKPLVELGGFIPCPDHHLPPDAKFDLVRHYCERMRARFG